MSEVVVDSAAFDIVFSTPVTTTALSTAATNLAAGQCVKLGTIATTVLRATGDSSTFIQWAVSAVYDPVQREIRFIGKEAGASTTGYHFLVYNEAANTWSNSRAVWSGGAAAQSGHGFDHNTVDPLTGDHYHRPYNDPVVRKWTATTGLWSNLPAITSANIAGGLTWFPGRGLYYHDGSRLRYFNGTAWSNIAGSFGADSYHNTIEYSKDANVAIFGGGNNGPAMWKLLADGTTASIAPSTFTLGGGYQQGVLCASGNSAKFLGYNKSTAAFISYNVATDTWSSVALASGSGATPINGAPPLAADFNQFVIATPVDEYDVSVWIQWRGASTSGDVWVYKHN